MSTEIQPQQHNDENLKKLLPKLLKTNSEVSKEVTLCKPV